MPKVKLEVTPTQALIIIKAIESDIQTVLCSPCYDNDQRIWLIGEREILSKNLESQLGEQDVFI